MDMMMVDVQTVENVQAGEIAVIIGSDGVEQIRTEEVAQKCGTISIEVLCHFGSRLDKVVAGGRIRPNIESGDKQKMETGSYSSCSDTEYLIQ
jgi:hypothetical protein